MSNRFLVASLVVQASLEGTLAALSKNSFLLESHSRKMTWSDQSDRSLPNRSQPASLDGFTRLDVSFGDTQRFEFQDHRCLNFMHIPKTGGTSIEEDGQLYARKSLIRTWGKFDRKLKCTHPNTGLGHMCNVGDPPRLCPIYHVPPAYDRGVKASYAACATFCVVREPVSRVVSEYYWRVTNGRITGPCSMSGFVTFATNLFTNRTKEKFGLQCHLARQVDYVFDKKGSNICNHVLRFSHLEDDFNKLMEQFKYPLKLTSHKYPSSECNIALPKIPKETLDMIRSFYHADYKYLRF